MEKLRGSTIEDETNGKGDCELSYERISESLATVIASHCAIKDEPFCFEIPF